MGFQQALEEAGVEQQPDDSDGYYGYHEYNDVLEDMYEDMLDMFPPEKPRVDFIEVSPQMSSNAALAYDKSEVPNTFDYCIRVSEEVVEKHNDSFIRTIVAHEMLHVWMYRNDYEYSDGDDVFSYLLGVLGAHMANTAPGGIEYSILREFLHHNDNRA